MPLDAGNAPETLPFSARSDALTQAQLLESTLVSEWAKLEVDASNIKYETNLSVKNESKYT